MNKDLRGGRHKLAVPISLALATVILVPVILWKRHGPPGSHLAPAAAATGAPAVGQASQPPPLFEPISLKGKITTATHNWEDAPNGMIYSRKVPFVCEGAIRLAGRQSAREGKRYAAAVFGVPIDQRGRQIHLLHGPEYGWAAPPGVPFGKIVLHYADGRTHAFYLYTQIHGVDWYVRPETREQKILDPNTSVGWYFERADGTSRQLFHTTLANPYPGTVIRHADLISTVEDPNLFLFGLTLGNEDMELAPELPPPAYMVTRQVVAMQLRDAAGQPVTNATVAWQITSRSYHMTFPPFTPDAQGRVEFDLPRRNLMKINYSVAAEDGTGAAGTLDSDSTGTFKPDVVIQLEPGGSAPLPANPSR